MKYAVVAGHNQYVPGAFGNGYAEHEVARQVKDRVIHYLQQLGETAHDCTDEVGKSKSLVWRNAARNCNRAIGKDGLIIAIHLNASGANASGCEVFDYQGTQKALCRRLSARLAKDFAWPDRGWKDGSWIGLIQETQAPVVYIELCFIDNISDITKLVRNLDMAAIGIVEEITGKKVPQMEPAKKTESSTPLQKMVDKGIIKGYPDGSLREHEPLTLARFAVIAERLGLLD